MKEKKKSDISVLMGYAGNYRILTIIGMILSALSMVLSIIPYICIWLVARDLITVAPQWSHATSIVTYGWIAFGCAIAGILIYFIGLMCTHLAAFRTASNIRKYGIAHLMKAPLGYFDTNASGLIRNRLDAAAADTETFLAHNLADIVGTITLFIAMLLLMVIFDWRMGAACLLAAVISIIAMFAMMGGENATFMTKYQHAMDRMSKAGTEYVRGIPVVKIFQQTVYSFKAFQKAIEEYSYFAHYFNAKVCSKPQSINLTFTEGAFVFLVPLALFIVPASIHDGNLLAFVTNFAFYAVFSAIISTALARIMFASNGIMMAHSALQRIEMVTNAPVLSVADHFEKAKDASITFNNVTFTYPQADGPAVSHISFSVQPGQTVALVGPSGGGKTTLATLIPRFWDIDSGTIEIGGVNIRSMDPKDLMQQIAFVFQNSHLFKTSIYENVRAARPTATRQEVLHALEIAHCNDILDKLPKGVDTIIGTKGTHLSGGEQQRIALASAILKNAPIVILDEATAFADPENEALIQKAMTNLMKDRTVIMIAHRLSTVVNADQIIVLDQGKIIESGTHDQLLLNHSLYTRMWEDYHHAIQWRIRAETEVA